MCVNFIYIKYAKNFIYLLGRVSIPGVEAFFFLCVFVLICGCVHSDNRSVFIGGGAEFPGVVAAALGVVRDSSGLELSRSCGVVGGVARIVSAAASAALARRSPSIGSQIIGRTTHSPRLGHSCRKPPLGGFRHFSV